MNVEDHLGVQTGPLDAEQASLSGHHQDLMDGTFSNRFLSNSKALDRQGGPST